MRLLLDTHVVLWLAEDSPRLSPQVRREVESADERPWLSVVCLWEMAVTMSLGRLAVDGDLGELADGLVLEELAVRSEHVRAVLGLPLHHRDPFDRLLVAQARVLGAVLVTSDPKMSAYDVPLLAA